MNTDPITIDARSSTTGLRDFQDHFSFTADLTIKGSAFRDILVGGSGNDKVNGNKGNDVFRSGAGDDIANGGRGHDVFHNDEGSDSFNGGGGIDTLIDDSSVWGRDLGFVSVNMTNGTHSFQALPTQNDTFSGIENYIFRGREDVSVFGSDTANTIRTGRGSDVVKGLQGHDLLFGGAGWDVLIGGAGNDRIFGGKGRDSIRGGTGDDTISAGQGNDQLSGGSGADIFVFNDVAWEHTNTIRDFQDGDDLIRVTNNSGFGAINISATNGGADTLIVLSGGTEIILQNVVSTAIDGNDFLLV